MPMSREEVLQAMLDVLRAYPGELTACVHGDCFTGTWRLPAGDAPSAAADAPARLNTMESCILQALYEAGQVLGGQEIADRAGYPYDAGIRHALADLRRRGLLSGAPGVAGYGLTSAGRDLAAASATAETQDEVPS